MRTIFAEYNPHQNSIDIYIYIYQCWLYAPHGLLGSRKEFKDYTRIRLCIDELLEYARLYLEGMMQVWVDAEDSLEI